MNNNFNHYNQILSKIKSEGLYKEERTIITPQNIKIKTQDGKNVLNFCANNYLGLANHPEIIKAAKSAMDLYGFGLASVRFICGTQDLHKELENEISSFFNTDDTILYSSCFDANGGLFETILDEEDAIISDSLNHASIIDGIRLSKAKRLRFKNNDMNDLEDKLKQTNDSRLKLIATDGVFSMDGYIAKLDQITKLAEKYDAMLMVDDSHATGFIGRTGRGSGEYHNVMKKVDIFTSTLGKALGGASGGFTTGRKDIIAVLRQRSRPYLFSNTLAPAIAAAGIKVFQMISSTTILRDKLEQNTRYFREKISKVGFEILKGNHPIVPIMLYDSLLAQEMANYMLEEGVYVVGFYYPVVPKNQARIRVQISASMTKNNLNYAIEKFAKVGKKMGIIKT